MRHRLALLVVSLMAVGSLQIVVTPAASAASACADPNCPWSPVTWPVRLLCRDALPELCPL